MKGTSAPLSRLLGYLKSLQDFISSRLLTFLKRKLIMVLRSKLRIPNALQNCAG